MVDPRALLDAYAAREWGSYYEKDRLDDVAPVVFAALSAVLDLNEEKDVNTWSACEHCTGEGPGIVAWPCPTVQAVITALEEDRG